MELGAHLGVRLRGVRTVVSGGPASDRGRRGRRAARLRLGERSRVTAGFPSPPAQGLLGLQPPAPGPALLRPPLPGASRPRLLSPHRRCWRKRDRERGVNMGLCPVLPAQQFPPSSGPRRSDSQTSVVQTPGSPVSTSPLRPCAQPRRSQPLRTPGDRPTSRRLGPWDSGLPGCTHLSAMLRLRPGLAGGREGARGAWRVSKGASGVTLKAPGTLVSSGLPKLPGGH